MIEWILSSCVLILAVLLIRRCLRSRLQPMLQYALWSLVLIRLLLPFQFFNNPVSVGGMVEEVKKQPAVQAVTDKLTKPDISFEQAYEQAVQDFQQAGQQVQPLPDYAAPGYKPQTPLQQHTQQLLDKATPAFRLENLLLAVWLGGITVTAVCFAVSNIRFLHVLHKRRRLLETHESGLKIYACSGLDTPCLFGVLRPSVYLLEEEAENETRKCHVVTHEVTHYRHGDHVWSLLRCICLILHWYNPLVWLAAILSRQDGELACDTATLQKLGEQQRVAYGQTLIEMTCAKTPGAGLMNTATTMTGGKAAIKERVMMIAKRPKTVLWALILAVAIAVAAVGCTASGISGGKGDAAEPTSPTTAPAEDATTAPTEPPATAPTDPFAAYVEGHKELTGEEFAPLRALLSDIHSPANMALFSEYADPKDVNIRYLLDGSENVENELTDAEWAFLESKNKEVRNMDVARNSTAQIDAVLMQLFGLKLSETNKVGLDAFNYFADTDSYYFAYTGSEFVFPEFVKAVWMEDGSIVVCYINHMNNEYNAPWDKRVVTVKPVDGGYHFLSNCIVDPYPINATIPAPEENLPNVIRKAYSYPIRDGMAGWDKLSADQRLEAAEVPQAYVTRLNAAALLETIYGYPCFREIEESNASSASEYDKYLKLAELPIVQMLLTKNNTAEQISQLNPQEFSVRQTMTQEDIALADRYYGILCRFLFYYKEEAYTYPVTPASPQWATMTKEEKIAACQVPEEELANMTPNALTLTLINLPLLADAGNDEAALRAAMETCNVLKAALFRENDAAIPSQKGVGGDVADYAKKYWSSAWDVYAGILQEEITVPYVFPLRRGTPEWEAASSEERSLSHRITREYLGRMTTPAILQTLYAYPSWRSIRQSASIHSAIGWEYQQARKLTIVQELQTRKDLKQWLATLDHESFEVRGMMSQEEIKDADYMYVFLRKRLPYYNEAPYTYPITPKSPEWATMTEAEKIAACQIPEEILGTLSADALNTTLFNYPLLADAAKQADAAAAIREMIKTSNAYQERGERSRNILALSSYYYELIEDYTESYKSIVHDVLNHQTNELPPEEWP